MSQDSVVMLLRQVSSNLPAAPRGLPEEIADLSFAQTCLLGDLFELERAGNRPLSLSALAQKSGFSKATICAALKKLRRTGYIHMQMDDRDNRRKEIVLTDRAWGVESSVKEHIAALERALCAGIPPKDLQTTERSLRTILQNEKSRSAASMGGRTEAL